MGITSTHWSLRKIDPIRKAGPKIVRNMVNLRPVSFGTDMAQVQDALWMSRNGKLLERFCGPGQVGGIADPTSLVLALVILSQLREHQGLPTYIALTDLKWGFDLASIDGMLLASFSVGVNGTDWLLLDDILDQDKRVLEMHGILSAVFVLGCGTAQGRRFSVHTFNGLMKIFADDLQHAVVGGTCAVAPSFAREVLLAAAHAVPASATDAEPSRSEQVEVI